MSLTTLTAGVLVLAVWVAVVALAGHLRGRRDQPAGSPPAHHDELHDWPVRELHDWDKRLLAAVSDPPAWEELRREGYIDRGQAIADVGRARSASPDSVIAGQLFGTAHVLSTIIGAIGDPQGCYWNVILELGVACHDLTALDHADAGQASDG